LRAQIEPGPAPQAAAFAAPQRHSAPQAAAEEEQPWRAQPEIPAPAAFASAEMEPEKPQEQVPETAEDWRRPAAFAVTSEVEEQPMSNGRMPHVEPARSAFSGQPEAAPPIEADRPLTPEPDKHQPEQDEIDESLLRELEVTLDPSDRRMTEKSEEDRSLEEEMARLLSELAGERRK
jgi:hypothetical protein